RIRPQQGPTRRSPLAGRRHRQVTPAQLPDHARPIRRGIRARRTRGQNSQPTRPRRARAVRHQVAPPSQTGRHEGRPMTERQYLIVIEGAEGLNYSAYAPDLPGCVTTGATREECEREMRDAITFHIEGLRDAG